MHIFYSTQLEGTRFRLDENDSKHLTRVLRLQEGEEILVINGSGSLFKCKVSTSDKRETIVEILSESKDYNKRDYLLHIAIAPTKSIDRLEWFIEKSVELGVDTITPVICDRSERRIIKIPRLERIIISAMKQSIKTKKTVLQEPITFTDFIKSSAGSNRFIAYCNPDGSRLKIDNIYNKGEDALVMIGPEGDFTQDEVDMAITSGFKGLSLGSSRLRTETAGITACSIIYFLNQ